MLINTISVIVSMKYQFNIVLDFILFIYFTKENQEVLRHNSIKKQKTVQPKI